MRAPARSFRLFNLRYRGAVDVWGPHLPVPDRGLSVSRSFKVVGDVLRFRVELWVYQDRMAQGSQPQHTWLRQNAEDPDIQLRSRLHIQFVNAFNKEPVETLLSYESNPVFADLGRHPPGFRPNITGMGICGLKLAADVVVHPDAKTDARQLTINLLVDKELFSKRPPTQYPALFCHLRLTRLESWGICGAAEVPGPAITDVEASAPPRAAAKDKPAAPAMPDAPAAKPSAPAAKPSAPAAKPSAPAAKASAPPAPTKASVAPAKAKAPIAKPKAAVPKKPPPKAKRR